MKPGASQGSAGAASWSDDERHSLGSCCPDYSTVCILSRVWRPAVGEDIPSQQASESVHEEAWVGRVYSSNLKISHEVEINKGCVVTVSQLPTPDFSTSAPGCGSIVRSWLGWTLMGKTDRSGLWLFRGALRGGDVFSSLLASCDSVKKGSYHTVWLVPTLSACSCSYAYGQAQLSGHRLGSGVGQPVCGGLLHP